jgi:hypothetical protein
MFNKNNEMNFIIYVAHYGFYVDVSENEIHLRSNDNKFEITFRIFNNEITYNITKNLFYMDEIDLINTIDEFIEDNRTKNKDNLYDLTINFLQYLS